MSKVPSQAVLIFSDGVTLLHTSQRRPPPKGELDSTITMIARILSRRPRLVQPVAWRYLTTETYRKSSLWVRVGTRR